MRNRAKTFFVIFLMLWASLATLSFVLERMDVNEQDAYLDVAIKSPKDGSNIIYRAHLIVITPSKGYINRNYAVVMFHTFILSANSLKPMGIELARRGFVVVIPDLPGHGSTEGDLLVDLNSSNIGISVASSVVYLKGFFDAICEYAKKLANPSNPFNVRLLFVGHSFGGGIAIVYSVFRSDVEAVVSLSPVGVDTPLKSSNYSFIAEKMNASNPRNVLIILPPIDEVHTVQNMLDTLEILGVDNPQVNKLHGDFRNGTARKLIISDLSEHYTVHLIGKTMRETIKWFSLAIDSPLEFNILIEPIRILMIYTALVFGFFSLFLIGPATSEYLGLISGGRRWPKPQIKSKAIRAGISWSIITIIFTILIGAVLLILAVISRYPTLIASALVFGYYIGSITALLLIISRWMNVSMKESLRLVGVELFKDWRNIIFGLIIAGLLFLIFESTIAQVTLSTIVLDRERIIAFLSMYWVALLFSIPYDFLFRRLIQEAYGGGTVSAAAIAATLSTLARFIYIFLLIGFLIAVTRLTGLGFLLMFLLFLVQISAETLAASLYLATREIIPEAVSNSIFWLALTTAISPAVTVIYTYVSIYAFMFTV